MQDTSSSELQPAIQSRVYINEVPTNLLIQEFADKYLVVVTQYRKLGCLALVTEDVAVPHSDNVVTHTVQVLLGPDTEVTQVIARRLAATCQTRKPVLVSATLKESSKEMMNAVCKELQQLQETGPSAT